MPRTLCACGRPNRPHPFMNLNVWYQVGKVIKLDVSVGHSLTGTYPGAQANAHDYGYSRAPYVLANITFRVAGSQT